MAVNEIDKAVQKLITMTGKKVEIGEKVWENASPNTAMQAQTISVDLKGASQILIRYRITYWTGSADAFAHKYALIDTGIQEVLEHGATTKDAHYYTHNKSRMVKAEDASITFGTGYVSKTDQSPITDGGSCLPLQIYTVKGVI